MFNAINKISALSTEKYFNGKVSIHGIILPHRKPL